MIHLRRLSFWFLFTVAAWPVAAQTPRSLLMEPIVAETAESGAVALVEKGRAAAIHVSVNDWAGVLRAARDLQADVERVSGVKPGFFAGAENVKSGEEESVVVIVGTLGRSALIDDLVARGKLKAEEIRGKWETFVIETVEAPLPGVKRALVIAGSDKRGTIYGVYEVSQQIGVSPWYWWADVSVAKRAEIFVKAGRFTSGEPVVKYRGIFLNDEAPALTGWAAEKFGGLNSQFYGKVFELMLRLRANYLWPAMWNNAFNEDDPENARLADEYGIVMGTSHHEPMVRSQQEWAKHGKGPWDYAKNEDGLKEFWSDGVRRNRAFESMVTLGMRGDGDEPMSEAANVALLEKIVADQRAILAKEVNADVTRVPQLWALYKEVQEYYERGMRVPDDVTLLWCDDNWGNLRRLPTEAERKRPGGAGVYYHFDYVGGPRNYKWLNVTPISKVWEQMHLAWQHEATRIWIVNVGDLKPMEFPIEFFLTYAWNPARWPYEKLGEYSRTWAAREFGEKHAGEIAALINGYTKLNRRRTPELLSPETFSLVNEREAERVLAEWTDLAERARKVDAALPEEARAAFLQLVLHPVEACANLNEMLVAAGRNRLHASQGRASAKAEGEWVRTLFAKDAAFTRRWDAMLDGKWRRMMDQIHIGYTIWQQPSASIMPAVTEVQVGEAGRLAIAVEGDVAARPGNYPVSAVAKLPELNAFKPGQTRWVEIFNRGAGRVAFTVETSEPWLRVMPASGELGPDVRVEVGANWSEVPAGERVARVLVKSADGQTLRVDVPVVKRNATGVKGFVETDRQVAMEALNFSRAVSGGGVEWKTLEGFGRMAGGVRAFPVTAKAVVPGGDSARLEYDVHLFSTGDVKVELHCAPSLDFLPGQPLSVAVSFDDAAPQVVKLGTWTSDATWEKAVAESVRRVLTTHRVERAGAHVLKIWCVTPGVVIERVVIDAGGVRPSYLGPRESRQVGTVNGRAAELARPRGDANSMLAHEQLVQKARAGRIDVYFLGDSITRRWGGTDYPDFLVHWKKNFHGWNAGNFGWGGDTTKNILWRITQGELDGVNPKVIVLLAGTNDLGKTPKPGAVADVVTGIATILEVCQAKAPEATIVLMGIFPRNDGERANAAINEVNEQIAKLADGKAVRFLNINDQLADAQGKLFEGVAVDKLHLSLKGYEVWAKNLKPMLTELLGPPAKVDVAPPPTGDPSAKPKAKAVTESKS
ncbi:glycosyl hydrolase 115 family protein [Nibricoccus aquaticus]|nr:glycosyl hydrolase 115 family protein [Nibricoccus aquaticus]